MLPIIFALVSYVGWGVGDIFGVVSARKLGGYSTTLWSYIFSIIILTFLLPFAPGNIRDFNLSTLFLNILLAIIGAVGFVAFNEGMRLSNASLVGTIAAAFATLAAVLSIVFLGERITTLQATAIVIAFVGVVFCTFNFKDLKKGKLIRNKGLILALVAMVTWGIYFAFIKIPIRQVGWFWPVYVGMISVLPLYLLFVRFRQIKIVKPTLKGALPYLLTGIITLRIAELSFNYAISIGLTAIVAPIAGSYPSLFVVLASIFFKDPITTQEKFGIVVTIAGVVLLSLLSA